MAIKKVVKRTLTVAAVGLAAVFSFGYISSIKTLYTTNHTECEGVQTTIDWVRTLHVLANVPFSTGTVALLVFGCIWRGGHIGEMVKLCAEDGCVAALTTTGLRIASLAVLLSWIISFTATSVGVVMVRVCGVALEREGRQLFSAAASCLVLTLLVQMCGTKPAVRDPPPKVEEEIRNLLLEESGGPTQVVCSVCHSRCEAHPI